MCRLLYIYTLRVRFGKFLFSFLTTFLVHFFEGGGVWCKSLSKYSVAAVKNDRLFEPTNFHQCKLLFFFADKEIKVPNKTEDSTFVFTISNGSVFDIIKKPFANVTDYLSANQTCQAKGGYLAVIDSSVKQQVVEGLIRQHLSNFSLQKASYLIGMFKSFQNTIKPVFNGYPRNPKIVVVIDRLLLFGGSFSKLQSGSP
jgi:hypothetical protein